MYSILHAKSIVHFFDSHSQVHVHRGNPKTPRLIPKKKCLSLLLLSIDTKSTSIPNFPARTSNHQPKAQLHHSQEVAGSCRPPWRIAVATLHALFSERRKVGLVCGLGFPLPRLRCFFWMIGEGKRWICFPPGHIPIVGKKNIKFPVLRFSQELSNKGWGMF